uniref:DUF148 domain-containing protein n=1 Tax=Strongyloides papillosus TaxID=174720 RepID=A0A0N5BTX5_STREA
MKYLLASIVISIFITLSFITADDGTFTFKKNCGGDPLNCQFTFTAPEKLMESIDEAEFNKTISQLEEGFTNLTSNIQKLETIGNDTITYLNNATTIINNQLASINSSITSISGNITSLQQEAESLTNDATKLIQAMICFLNSENPSSSCY